MRYAFAISWLGFIAILHALPADDIPNYTFLDWLHADKWFHAFMFLVACLLCAYANQKQYNRPAFRFIIIGLAIYGLTLEFFQEYFFDNRSMEVLDWLADMCGTLIGVILFRKIAFLTSSTSTKKV